MKKSILLFTVLMAILSTVAYSAYNTHTTADTWLYQEGADESNFTGSSNNAWLYNYTAFTDGDWNTYALVNGTYYRNYTKKTDYTSASLWQVKFNVSPVEVNANLSIPSACWENDTTKIITMVNTSNVSNAHYCWDGSWAIIGVVKDRQAVYDDAMNFRVAGRTYNISYNPVVPAEYATFDSVTVNFSLNVNDTNADINHTTFNCTLYTRLSSTASYVANVSDVVIINNTVNSGNTVAFADGNRVWWYWGCEDNYSRAIFNTSSRLFDIDLVYYALSLGANKVINFSVDSGEVVIRGGIKVANITLTEDGENLLGNVQFNVTKEIEISPTDLALAGATVPARSALYNYQTLEFGNGTVNDFMVNLQLPPDYKNDTSLFVNILWAPNSSNTGNVSWCVNSSFTTEDVSESINMTPIGKCVFDETQSLIYALHRTPDITINASRMTNEDILGLRFWRNLTVRASDYGNGTYFMGATIKYTSYRLGTK